MWKDRLITFAIVVAGVIAASFVSGFIARRSAAAAAAPKA